MYENNKVISMQWQNNTLYTDIEHFHDAIKSQYIILATGGFFSNGLISKLNKVYEPIIGADIYYKPQTTQWADSMFKQFERHHFLEMGVETDEKLQVLKSKQPIPNIYAVGTVLAHFNPLAEGSAGGVSISSAYFVAQNIIKGG